MKLETIKRNNKKNIIIGSMIVLSVIGCLTLTTSRAKYKSVQSLKLASGTVKINSYDLKIMAMYQQKEDTDCTEDSCYDVLTGRMPSSGYAVNTEKSYCTIDGKNKDAEAILKTIDGHHVVENLIKNEKCYVWFDKYIPPTSEMIIANIENSGARYKGTTTPTFTSIATGEETAANNGIFKTSDGMYGGYTYYWRGAATTNHVIFDNKCWRIVRINGDKSIRLIYNGTSSGNRCTQGANSAAVIMSSTDAEKYYATSDGKYDNSSYVGWTYTLNRQRTISGTPSVAKIQSENWYIDNISASAKTKIDTLGKFCNDRNTKNNETWRATGPAQYYAGYTRIYETSKPTLSCSSGDIYSLAVGAITADEVMFAGGKNVENTSYYMNAGADYWTMSPSDWYNWNSSWARVFFVGTKGYLNSYYVNNTAGIRPVINLRSDITFNEGSDGTQNNPYVVQ